MQVNRRRSFAVWETPWSSERVAFVWSPRYLYKRQLCHGVKEDIVTRKCLPFDNKFLLPPSYRPVALCIGRLHDHSRHDSFSLPYLGRRRHSFDFILHPVAPL